MAFASEAVHQPSSRVAGWLVLAGATVVAIVSARSYAGSWNDGSRLATVESLVDRHTFVIDDSIFVQVPRPGDPAGAAPYPRDDPMLLQYGTGDKLFINGHFYSDKSPVPAVLMAGVYQGLQWITGVTARRQPGQFCYWLTLASSGLAYVVATWCIFQLGAPLRLSMFLRVLLTASFGGATVALPYARQVNSHILLLAVTSALLLCLARLAEDTRRRRRPAWSRALAVGVLAGLAYTLDLGIGPALLASTLGVVAYRSRSLSLAALVVCAAAPWVIAHHALNYAIGGTFQPANMVPEYFAWPGSPFNPSNLTGTWKHSLPDLLIYASGLLVGRRGFLSHNLPVILALVAFTRLLRRRTAESPEILLAGVVCGATWLVYAMTSNNYSGACASIRWFVPLLAPAYFVLAVFLREQPDYRRDLVLLSGWGAIVAACMWWKGPWMKDMVPFFLPLQAAALVSWFVYRERRGW